MAALLFAPAAFAQQTSDELYTEARKQAFDNKNYKEAITLAQKALEQTPDYPDLNIFIGRLYTWDGQTENARNTFDSVVKKYPNNQDAYLAYGSLEYWSKNYDKALKLTDKGLAISPKSEELLLLRARILSDSRKYPEANN